jgi:hypothetical protein
MSIVEDGKGGVAICSCDTDPTRVDALTIPSLMPPSPVNPKVNQKFLSTFWFGHL